MIKRIVFIYLLIGVHTTGITQNSCDSIYENPEVSAQFISANDLFDLSVKISAILYDSGLIEEALCFSNFQLTINKYGQIVNFSIQNLHNNEANNKNIFQIISKEFLLNPAINEGQIVCSLLKVKSFILLH